MTRLAEGSRHQGCPVWAKKPSEVALFPPSPFFFFCSPLDRRARLAEDGNAKRPLQKPPGLKAGCHPRKGNHGAGRVFAETSGRAVP